MATRAPSPCLSLVPSPTAAEAAALTVVGAYLARAGTRAASLLLGHAPHAPNGPLLAAVRDQLLGGAALCDGLLDLADPRGRV